MLKMMHKGLVALALLLLVPSANVLGQETAPAGQPIFPTHGFLVTGYGSAGYQATFLGQDETPNDFLASLNPVLLWQIADRFLFEAEIEFGLEEGATETNLEYAQIDYSLTNNVSLAAGKMLLPFNIFSERLHPTWVNKLVDFPPLYGPEHSFGSTRPLLPIVNDVGVQLRGTIGLQDFWYATGAAFVSQGPSIVEEEEEGEPVEGPYDVPSIAFGTNFEDNNDTKMFGGRLGIGLAPYFELNVSAMTGDYDPDGRLRLTAYGAHLEGRYRGFELHGEWIQTDQDVTLIADPNQVDKLTRNGYWAMVDYRFMKWNPVIRWTQIFDGNVNDLTVLEPGRQLALGLAYWLQPSLVLKAQYLVNYEDANIENNRLAFQWAFGF